MSHDYKRHGVTTLFAALDVLEGKVIGQCCLRPRCLTQPPAKFEAPLIPARLDNDMDCFPLGRPRLDNVQEADELLMAMAAWIWLFSSTERTMAWMGGLA